MRIISAIISGTAKNVSFCEIRSLKKYPRHTQRVGGQMYGRAGLVMEDGDIVFNDCIAGV
jgi:hypothetical protein